MHLEILVEDVSGKKMFDILLPKLLPKRDPEITFRVIPYRGIGRLPKGLKLSGNAQKRILFDQLPKLLRGYGKTFAGYPPESPAAVLVVCDLDHQSVHSLRSELEALRSACSPAPVTRFCIAIEEGEAWLLGDGDAVRRAYPHAKRRVLEAYVQDSICGTWEILADALYSGGGLELKKQSWHVIGLEKSHWAEKISPFIDVERNASPSFAQFRDALREVCNR